MSETVSGGKLAAKTNKERHGEDFYNIQGAKGGRVTGVKKGFAHPTANPGAAGLNRKKESQ